MFTVCLDNVPENYVERGCFHYEGWWIVGFGTAIRGGSQAYILRLNTLRTLDDIHTWFRSVFGNEPIGGTIFSVIHRAVSLLSFGVASSFERTPPIWFDILSIRAKRSDFGHRAEGGSG